jgi:hypothetical protein
MGTSATAIWVICIVAVVGLAVWLASVALAARKPYRGNGREPQKGRWRVQGGTHVSSGGRSVSPRPDEPVTGDQWVEPTGPATRPPDGEADDPRPARRGSTSPMDL